MASLQRQLSGFRRGREGSVGVADGGVSAGHCPGVAPLLARGLCFGQPAGLCHEVERLVWSAGYYGPMTACPPPPTLKSALEQIVLAGLAQLGSGLTRSGPQMADLPAASGDPRWQSQFKPDLRLAAPEIDLNVRAEGVSNTRE